MASIYSKRLLSVPAGGSAQFAVPAGSTAVIRTVCAYFSAGSGFGLYEVVISPGNFPVVYGFTGALTGSAIFSTPIHDLHVAVAAGESIAGACGANVAMVVSGYLFLS